MGTRTAARTKAKTQRKARQQRSLRNRTSGGSSPIELAHEICQVQGSIDPYLHPAHCTLGAGECGDSPAGVSNLKQVAAAALILGQNVTKTAEALGVDRRTVQRWGKYDPEFQQAMAETKQEVVIVTRQSLLALAESAVERVETQLASEKNPRLALALLRGAGVLCPAPLVTPTAKAETENKNRAQSATSVASDASAESDSPAEKRATDSAAQAVVSAEGAKEDSATEEAVYELADLLPEQQRAVAGLFAGKTVAEVAELVSTNQDTIRGWLREEGGFFTILSEMQLSRIAQLKYRLLKLLQTAVEIVRQGIAAGNGRLALALVRGMGLLQ